MPLDQHLEKIIQSLAGAGRKPPHECTVEESRRGYQLLTQGTLLPDQVVAVAAVENISLRGADADLGARMYRPMADELRPAIVFFHGGGFVLGSIDTHDNMCRAICTASQCTVISVEYRLAPEWPFPAAVDDAIAATKWVVEHYSELGCTDVIGVAGDSAGGNLAAVVAQQMHLEGVQLGGQFLIYPAVDVYSAEYPSRTENAVGYFLELRTLQWFFDHYVGDLDSYSNSRLAPMQATDLSGLSAAVIVTAEFDPLRDEGEAYGAKLQSAGVDSIVERGAGMVHGFFDMGRWSPAAQSIIERTASNFGELLRTK